MMFQDRRRGRGVGRMILCAAAVCGAGVPLARAADTTQKSLAQPATRPVVDPRAAEIFRAASQYLTDAKSYTFSGDVWEDVMLPDGRKVKRQRTVHVGVRRPDRLYAESTNPSITRSAWYDGKTFTFYNRTKNLYGVLEAPDNIDKTVALVGDKFGINMPLSDLIVSNLYADAMKDVVRGDYLGRQTVGGVPCHHVAFSVPGADWEAWVEDGAAPVVRRLVITYKDEPMAPQFTATLSDWNFDAKLPDYAFTFRPPEGAQKITVLEAKAPPGTKDQGDAAREAKEVQQPTNPVAPGGAPQDKKD